MTIDPLQFAPAVFGGQTGQARALDRASGDFTAWLKHEVAAVNEQIIKADDGVRRLALGESDNLHQVMIGLEQAKLSFELIVQIRNKLLDAYQDVMRMQI